MGGKSRPYIYIYKHKRFLLYLYYIGDRGGTVVKVLCYNTEGRWLDPSWCQCLPFRS